MSKIEDGGAAFPCEGGCDSGLHHAAEEVDRIVN
jgi:hypothetical protein